MNPECPKDTRPQLPVRMLRPCALTTLMAMMVARVSNELEAQDGTLKKKTRRTPSHIQCALVRNMPMSWL